MPDFYNPVRPKPSVNAPIWEKGNADKTNMENEQARDGAPYPVADGAGDGASKGYKPALSKTMGSTNVPQPDNQGPTANASGDGKNGMAG